MNRVSAVVAAGGIGTRMKSSEPKQFIELAGKPILVRTLENVQAVKGLAEIVVVLPAKHIRAARRLMQRQSWAVPVKFASGGATRQESVRRGVARTDPDSGLILVHDAVRPLCDPETMRRVVAAAWEHGAAVPGLPATDTIQRVSPEGLVLETPPREQLYIIQTPQCFHAGILRSALECASRTGFAGTDESSVVRRAGHAVVVVPGSPSNIKITHPSDLSYAEILMEQSEPEAAVRHSSGKRTMNRIGQGVDYHRLVEGRKLVLGGVEIPFEKGLEGHSDADALTHAICDALLGAAALGDIGQHFPDTDPVHGGRSSLEFLCEVRAKVENAGWLVRNVDATILAQRPRLASFMPGMRLNIAECLGLSPDEVSIKATTTEGMNAEGHGEGISAQAVALLEGKQRGGRS